MPCRVTAMFVLLALPAVAFATAQPARHASEARADHRRIVMDRAWAERDARELAEFETLSATLRDAFEDRMSGRYREVNASLQAAIVREVEQARVKQAQAVNEARKSRRELRGERMEAAMGGGPMPFPQAVDDRHGVNVDGRDRRGVFARCDEMVRLGTLCGATQNGIERGERTAMARNVELANRFLELVRADAAAHATERTEDGRELREERRNDRR